MNSNQRSQENNQTDNMANEKSVSSLRGGTTENYSKQKSSPGTGKPGGGSKQSGTPSTPQDSQGGSEQSAPYHHQVQPGEDAPEQAQGSAGMSMQSEANVGDYHYAHGRGHKAQQSMEQDASVGSGDWEGALSRRGASRQSSQAEGSASGSQQSVGRGPGSQGSQVGGMDWQSESELGAQQSRVGSQGEEQWVGEVRSQQSQGGSGSQQSQRGSGSQQSQGGSGSQQSQRGSGSQQSQRDLESQQSYGAGSQQSGGAGSRQSQGAGAGLGKQPSGGSHGSQATGQGGTQKLGGSGQGQHAQSSGGNEGSDKPPTRVAREGAGMPAQRDVGRSAQTQPGKGGLEGTGQSLGSDDDLRTQSGQSRQSGRQGGGQAQPQGGGRVNESSQPQDRGASSQSSQQGEARPDSAAGGAQLSGSTNSLNTDSTGRVGSQTGNEQMAQGYDDVGNQRYSNDSSGGYPRSPAGKRLSAQQDMDDDTGLSNASNMQEIDMGTKQPEQSNVGRRSDMTPD